MSLPLVQVVHLITPALLYGCIALPTIITSTVFAVIAKLVIAPQVYAQAYSTKMVCESLAWVLIVFLFASLKWVLLRQYTTQEAKT